SVELTSRRNTNSRSNDIFNRNRERGINMAKQLNGSLYYLVANVRYSFIIFWIILMVMFAVTIISALLVPDSVISFQLAAPIYVFAAVIGFWTVKNAFPYLIKMGSTRKNIFLSFGI